MIFKVNTKNQMLQRYAFEDITNTRKLLKLSRFCDNYFTIWITVIFWQLLNT